MKKVVLVLLTLTIMLSIVAVPLQAMASAPIELIAIPASMITPTCKHPSVRYQGFSQFYNRYPDGRMGLVEKGFYFCNVCNLALLEKLTYLEPIKVVKKK